MASTKAVLPTPGSPTSKTLGFCLRPNTRSIRWIKLSRPKYGSNLPSSARLVRSGAKRSNGLSSLNWLDWLNCLPGPWVAPPGDTVWAFCTVASPSPSFTICMMAFRKAARRGLDAEPPEPESYFPTLEENTMIQWIYIYPQTGTFADPETHPLRAFVPFLPGRVLAFGLFFFLHFLSHRVLLYILDTDTYPNLM